MTAPPRVFHYNDPAKPPDAVYVGRAVKRVGVAASPWGNPFGTWNSADPIADFRAYAIKRLARQPGWLDPLRGKSLVCWCKGYVSPRTGKRSEDYRCHADVLLELANDG